MTTCHHDSLGRRIYLVSQEIRHNIERLLKPFDLTTEQPHLLHNLDLQRGRTQCQTGASTRKSAANTTRRLDRLEKKNLIVRRETPAGWRSQLVFLTTQGVDLSQEMPGLLETLSTRIEENIDKHDMTVVVRALDRIEANLFLIAQNPGD